MRLRLHGMKAHPFHDIVTILPSNRESVLGCQAVLNIEDHDATLQRHRTARDIIRLQAASDKTSAMEVNDEREMTILVGRTVRTYKHRVSVLCRYAEFRNIEAFLRCDGVALTAHALDTCAWRKIVRKLKKKRSAYHWILKTWADEHELYIFPLLVWDCIVPVFRHFECLWVFL